MALAASGVLHETLGHLSSMQDAYDYVKHKSSCIGPNVSYVLFSLLNDQAITNPFSPL